MVQSVRELYEIAYDAEVKRQYQGKLSLIDKTYTKGNFVGSELYFNRVGQVQAVEHNPFTDLTYGDGGYNRVKCTFKDWDCAQLVDRPQQHNFTPDEARIDAEQSADVVVRRLNQTIIDALVATTTPHVGTANTPHVGTANTQLNVQTLRNVKRKFDKAGVPTSERYILLTADQLSSLLGQTEVTSSDYNSIKALVNGELNTFLGFQFTLVSDMKEGGLPTGYDTTLSTNYETAIAFHKRSIGFGVPKDGEIKTSMDWLPTKQAWQVNATVSCGSVVIDDTGVIPIWTTLY
jgi:hypothetical protein